MTESYDIEPWMPAISPGAPVPAPKYVPFDYGKMTPGNYFVHSVGASDAPGNAYGKPKSWGSTKPPANVLEDIYKNGIKVRTKGGPDAQLRPTAWNYKLDRKHLVDPKKTMRQMGEVDGLANPNYKSDPMRKHPSVPGSNFTKSKYGANGPGYDPPVLPRTPKTASLNTVVMKGDPNMFSQKGPNYIPETPTTGNIDPKRIIGHFPKGSNQMVRPPGSVTGQMPRLRLLGGSMVDMFSFPGIPGVINKGPVETEDIFGRPIEDKRSYEEMVATGGAI